MDQAKSQWAAGEVAAVTSFRSTVLLSRDQTCPSSSRPVSGVFSQLLSRMRKDRACQNQGGAHIMTAVETVNITEPKGRGGLLWGNVGRGDRPYPSFYCPRRLQEPTCFHLRGPTSRNWFPKQGLCDPECSVWEVESPWRLWKCAGSGDCVGFIPST